MTVLERLRSTGAPEDEAQRAASAIGALLPVDRGVLVTDEVLDAARAGDLALVVMGVWGAMERKRHLRRDGGLGCRQPVDRDPVNAEGLGHFARRSALSQQA